MKTSKMIRQAKKYLWDGQGFRFHKVSHICFVIEDMTKFPKRQRDRVIELIDGRLEPCVSLQGWLLSQGIPECDLTPVRVQRHRLEWMEILAKEFEDKGD